MSEFQVSWAGLKAIIEQGNSVPEGGMIVGLPLHHDPTIKHVQRKIPEDAPW